MTTSNRPGPGSHPDAPRSTRWPWWPVALVALVGAAAAASAYHAPVRTPARLWQEVLPSDPRAVVLYDRSVRQREIALAAVRGEIDLMVAAGRFRDLAADDPVSQHYLLQAYPGITDDERYARAVIRWARAELDRRRADRAPADRLEAELTSRLAAGRLKLPVSPEPQAEL